MGNPEFSSLERRKHPRLSVNLPLEYKPVYDFHLRTGLLANLSNKGVLFYCRADMSVGTIIIMTVMYPDDFALSSFEVRAKIIWKDLLFDRDWREYKYGAEFLYVSEQDQVKLNRVLCAYPFGDALGSEEMFF